MKKKVRWPTEVNVRKHVPKINLLLLTKGSPARAEATKLVAADPTLQKLYKDLKRDFGLIFFNVERIDNATK